MKYYLFSIIFFSFYSISTVFGQVSAPKYANEFLNLGIGGRALAMGNVQVGIVNDATAGYWNPAGLMRQNHQYNISLMHSELLAGIVKNDYAAFSMPLDSSSYIGISMIRVGVDDIPNTLNLVDQNGVINYDNITYFSVADYAFIFSYARNSNWLPGLKIGANAKIIYRHVGPFATAWGFGLDGSAILEKNNWLIGAVLRDATSTPTAWFHNTDLVSDVYLQTNNEIPENAIELALPRLVLGVGRQFEPVEKLTVTPAADLEITSDGKRNVLVRTDAVSIDPRFGLEVGYQDIIFLRGGVNNMQQIENFDESKKWVAQPNFGLGLKINRFSIDYALSKMNDGDDGLFSHIFSIKAYFD